MGQLVAPSSQSVEVVKVAFTLFKGVEGQGQDLRLVFFKISDGPVWVGGDHEDVNSSSRSDWTISASGTTSVTTRIRAKVVMTL